MGCDEASLYLLWKMRHKLPSRQHSKFGFFSRIKSSEVQCTGRQGDIRISDFERAVQPNSDTHLLKLMLRIIDLLPYSVRDGLGEVSAEIGLCGLLFTDQHILFRDNLAFRMHAQPYSLLSACQLYLHNIDYDRNLELHRFVYGWSLQRQH